MEQFTLYIPSEISSDTNLNLSEMRVLATIKALDNKSNCYAHNQYFADCLNISVRQVSRIIQQLAAKGYIVIEHAKSFRRKIKLVVKQVKEVVKQTISKAKQLKQVVASKAEVKPYVSAKVAKFNSLGTNERDWDFDAIEQLEQFKIMLDLGQITLDEYKAATEPLIKNGSE